MIRLVSLRFQFVFKPEPYTCTNVKTVHEELAKAMTAILRPSTDFLTSNKLLKVQTLLKAKTVGETSRLSSHQKRNFVSVLQHSWYFFEALVKSMAHYLIEVGKVKVNLVLASSSTLLLCSPVSNFSRFLHPALQEPAFFRVILPRCGDSGQYADAPHHAEIQGQPGCSAQRQSQPGGFY